MTDERVFAYGNTGVLHRDDFDHLGPVERVDMHAAHGIQRHVSLRFDEKAADIAGQGRGTVSEDVAETIFWDVIREIERDIHASKTGRTRLYREGEWDVAFAVAQELGWDFPEERISDPMTDYMIIDDDWDYE